MFLPSTQRNGQPWYVWTLFFSTIVVHPGPLTCFRILSFILLGILSRSGRGIKFTDLTYQIRTTYNFSASFCSFVPHIAARMLQRNYGEETFDLEELDLHNGIEHDGSLTRT